MTTPKLYVFVISHYCEKARWALDRLGLKYQLQHTMPGMNRAIAKRLGAQSGSLPFLETDAGVIAGSGAIIDWAEMHRAPGSAGLSGNDPAQVRALEQRLDEVIGVHPALLLFRCANRRSCFGSPDLFARSGHHTENRSDAGLE